MAVAGENNILVNTAGTPDLNGMYKRTTAVTTNYAGDTSLALLTVSVDYQVNGAFVNHPIQLTSVVSQYA